MDFIISLLINAALIFGIAYVMPQVDIKNFGTAILVALLVGLLNATVGFLLRLPLNLVTLGLMTFVVRLLVTALVIKLVDKFLSGFEVKGFWPAVVIALVIAIAGSFMDQTLHNGYQNARVNTTR
ncbi:MAG: phage holin family protein [Ferruginibacter sp.]|nr:phage holin family protein [Cytophagales bacterium]